jgi:hypothetical protein
MKHEKFAERAGRRLEKIADRLEGVVDELEMDTSASSEALVTAARAQELRVAAQVVREEAAAVGREEQEPKPESASEPPTEKIVENPPLEAQG